jgi:hypothetical protein
MDFLRMEGEQAFLLFLPEEERLDARDYWYRGCPFTCATTSCRRKTEGYERPHRSATALTTRGASSCKCCGRTFPRRGRWRYVDSPPLRALMDAPNAASANLPEVAFLQVLDSRGECSTTRWSTTAPSLNNAQLFQEEDRRIPEEDTLTVTRGFVGAYPEHVFPGDRARVGALYIALESLADRGRLHAAGRALWCAPHGALVLETQRRYAQ